MSSAGVVIMAPSKSPKHNGSFSHNGSLGHNGAQSHHGSLVHSGALKHQTTGLLDCDGELSAFVKGNSSVARGSLAGSPSGLRKSEAATSGSLKPRLLADSHSSSHGSGLNQSQSALEESESIDPFHGVDDEALAAMRKALVFLQRVRADNHLHTVCDRLYIGSVGAALNLAELKERRVTHILCVATGIRDVYKDRFTYKTVTMLDSKSTVLLDFLPECIEWIERVLSESQQTRILVHCFAGRSRSVTILAAYLMYRFQISLSKALTTIREVRPNACPNPGFLDQLKAFEVDLFSVIKRLDDSIIVCDLDRRAIANPIPVSEMRSVLTSVSMAAKRRLGTMNCSNDSCCVSSKCGDSNSSCHNPPVLKAANRVGKSVGFMFAMVIISVLVVLGSSVFEQWRRMAFACESSYDSIWKSWT